MTGGKVRMLCVSTASHHTFKQGADTIRLNDTEIIIRGKGDLGDPSKPSKLLRSLDWEVVIPFSAVHRVQQGSFYAEGAVYHVEDMVGIDATIDGVVWSYGIKTSVNCSKALFDAIQQHMK